MTVGFFNRRYIVNYRLQLMVISYGFIMCLAGMKLFELFYQFYTESGVVLFGFVSISTTYLLVLVCMFFFLFLIAGLIISNHIAGPIYRLNLHMKMIAAGEKVDPLVIRKYDYFKDLVASYNQLLERKVNKNQ